MFGVYTFLRFFFTVSITTPAMSTAAQEQEMMIKGVFALRLSLFA